MVRLYLAAERAEVGGEGVCDGLRAPSRERPTDMVAEEGEHEPGCGARRSRERKDRMSCQAREQTAGVRAVEMTPGHSGSREDRVQAEAGEDERMPRQPEGAEYLAQDRVGISYQRPHEARIRRRIGAERSRRAGKRALEHRGGAVVERVRERGRRFDPLEPVLLERQRAEERRALDERVDCRADVVPKSGQRQLGGACAAADGVGRFEDEHGPPGAGEHDRRREPVRPGTDDDSVVHAVYGRPSLRA